MKSILLTATFLCFITISFAQTEFLVGAWHCNDSTKQISMFIKQDGSISMHFGEKGGSILTKDLKEGKYEYRKDVLIIKWLDDSVSKYDVKSIDKYNIELKYLDTGNKRSTKKLSFRKIVDVEVTEE